MNFKQNKTIPVVWLHLMINKSNQFIIQKADIVFCKSDFQLQWHCKGTHHTHMNIEEMEGG